MKKGSSAAPFTSQPASFDSIEDRPYRLSPIQIELVGFAVRPEDTSALSNLRRLLRDLEQEFSIPRAWPNGYPIPAVKQAELDDGGCGIVAQTPEAGHD